METSTPHNTKKVALQATYYSIATNIILTVVKSIAGYWGNTYALVADAIESGTDIIASLLILLVIYYTQKPADKNHPWQGRATCNICSSRYTYYIGYNNCN
jgi:divalent metal cation (Fe/Co/Zn/Cd) transporter